MKLRKTENSTKDCEEAAQDGAIIDLIDEVGEIPEALGRVEARK